MSDVTISQARREEAPIILDFIMKLAKYERMSKEVKATINDIEKHIFDQKHAEVIFLRDDGKPIGFAVYYFKFSTFLARPTLHLEDFFVIDSERGKGYGKMVLKYLAKTALDRGCKRFEWDCLEWNKPSIRFYENLGAKALRGWVPYRMDGKQLIEFANK